MSYPHPPGARIWQTAGDPQTLAFTCPGCKCAHAIPLGPGSTLTRTGTEQWTWNGSWERPTFEPSLDYQAAPRCHSFVRDGKIQFLADCGHALAGQTVELEEVE